MVKKLKAINYIINKFIELILLSCKLIKYNRKLKD